MSATALSVPERPLFLFVVDTEGDDEWTTHRRLPPVRNLSALPRFQGLCERYGVKPTYVVTHSVATSDEGVSTLRPWMSAGRCEVGTHLHPWTAPPWRSPWDDAATFPSELPDDLLEAKLTGLTETISARFGRRPTSYRAGRFGYDARTLRLLESLGYTVDTSVTPLTSWKKYPGLPGGPGGPDFTAAPLGPYRPDRDDPTREGESALVEIPQTIVDDDRLPGVLSSQAAALPEGHLAGRVLSKLHLRRRLWLRPTLESIGAMVDVCAAAERHGVRVFNMMIHSSELFPNTSPYFRDQRSIDGLFARIEGAFGRIFHRWNPEGVTLSEAAARLSA